MDNLAAAMSSGPNQARASKREGGCVDDQPFRT